jgi:hypothetical protein
MDNGTESAITLTGTPALYTKITDSATYPTNAAGIGMRSTGAAVDTFLYEAGTLIAYKPGAGAVSAAITGTSPASLTESNLNGATVTVTITNGTYDASLFTTDFTLNGAPAGTTISGVARDSATQATLTLAFTGTDFDVNASMSVTVLQAALATGTGPATTGTVTVTAVVEVTASITGTSPASLTETNLNGATVTVTITNGTYDASLFTTDFTLNGAPAGTTISGVARDSATQATLTLAFTGTDFDVNASMSVTVLQAALATGTGPATTGTVTVTAVVECAAPSDAAYVVANAQTTQVIVYWSSANPVVILEKTNEAFSTEKPANGTAYSVNDTGLSLGTAVVRQVGSATSLTRTSKAALQFRCRSSILRARNGRNLSGNFFCARVLSRSSVKGTMPMLGSMVVNGKFSAAIPAPVRALKRVDFPTLGKPMIPISTKKLP